MFGIKNYKKFNWINFGFISILLTLFLMPTVKAHEMWIEPLNYSIKLGDKILANEKVGQNFKGNNYSYLDSSYKTLTISVGNNTNGVNSRLGDIPIIQEATIQEGLHIITAETTPSKLTYESAEKFSNFLNQDGLQWVFAEHKKRGLPEKDFTEVYHRYPKTLVKVGEGKGKDRAFGMPLEWVVETNPYTSKGNIKAQLLWQGKPAIAMHVNVFNKYMSKFELIKTSLKTDSEGKIEIPRAKGGLFLINAVKMIEPDKKITTQNDVAWESLWASLSYEVLLNN